MKEKLPCSADEYMHRFHRVIAVFFHHVVFDPSRGECVSLSAAFPQYDRGLPDVVLSEVCGKYWSKDCAAQIAKGLLNARTLEPVPQEALTPSERRCIDNLLAQKRSDQREHNFQHTLREDARRLQEARVAAPTASAQISSRGPDVGEAASRENAAPPSHHGRSQAHSVSSSRAEVLCEDEADLHDEPKREMELLPGDLQRILALRAEVRSGDAVETQRPMMSEVKHHIEVDIAPTPAKQEEFVETPPRHTTTSHHGGVASAVTSPQASANPFTRRRPAAGAHLDEVPKRARLSFGTRPSTANAGTSSHKEGRCSCGTMFTPDSKFCRVCGSPRPVQQSQRLPMTETQKPRHDQEVRQQLTEAEYHPKGGAAAHLAAEAVLAHRRGVSLQPQERSKGTLEAFFKTSGKHATAKQEVQPVQPPPGKKAALSTWKARPWERDDALDDPPLDATNSLSLNAARKHAFRNQGNWECGNM